MYYQKNKHIVYTFSVYHPEKYLSMILLIFLKMNGIVFLNANAPTEFESLILNAQKKQADKRLAFLCKYDIILLSPVFNEISRIARCEIIFCKNCEI